MKSLDNSYNGTDLLTNYLMLAQAILFSDYDDGQDFCVCVYDTEENDRLVAVFNNDKGIAKMFGITYDYVQKSRSYGLLIRGRFKTERFECGTTSSKAEFYSIINNEENRKGISYLTKLMR